MVSLDNSWKPSAMVESETHGEAPFGFTSVRLVAQRIVMDILEPTKLENIRRLEDNNFRTPTKGGCP